MAELTAEEKRNLEVIKAWAEAWDKDVALMVDKIYADSPEVFLPLQKIYMSRKGGKKASWRAVEVANQKLFTSRKMNFVTLIAKGDTVAMEVKSSDTTLKGQVREGYWAAFLKFDKDGRIISDHTYMLNADKTPDPEKAHDPKIKKIMQELKDAHDKVMAEQSK